MTDSTINRKKGIVIFCSLYLVLTSCYYHIDKYLSGIIFIILTILIPVLFITILAYVIKGSIEILRNRKHLTFKLYFPILIALITLIYSVFSPFRLTSEYLESKIIFRACFEGTQNQAYIKFRADNTFEINWTGAFGYDEWFYGAYKKNADTFFLNYKTEKPFRFGDTIINNGQSLITINKLRKDSSQYFVPFYLGYCKGLN